MSEHEVKVRDGACGPCVFKKSSPPGRLHGSFPEHWVNAARRKMCACIKNPPGTICYGSMHLGEGDFMTLEEFLVYHKGGG